MARYEFRMQRLFVADDLAPGATFKLDHHQAHYLLKVLRMSVEDNVLVFNGRHGEWRAAIAEAGKKQCVVRAIEQIRGQTEPSNLHYLFAPLKQARLDYMVQKAVEMGVGALRPVITQHTQMPKIKMDRVRANAVEAVEQCGILSLPTVHAPVKLTDVITNWGMTDSDRRIIFCDEDDEAGDPISVLRDIGQNPLAVLIGPEGGFSAEERALLNAQEFVTSMSLGPRILRADTAAVSALTLVQAVCGDW